MIENLDQQTVRSLLDELQYSTRVDKDGDLYMILPADSDFDHSVLVYFQIENKEWLRVLGLAAGYEVEPQNAAKVILALNEHNAKKKYPKAYLHDNVINLEHHFRICKPVSKEYLKENLSIFPALIWNFFKEFNR